MSGPHVQHTIGAEQLGFLLLQAQGSLLMNKQENEKEQL